MDVTSYPLSGLKGDNVELTKEFRFEASHILPKHPGKCSRLHGHSWVLRVSVSGKINPQTGFVQDYADIKKVVSPIIEALDHRHLGTWEFLPSDPYNEWSLVDFLRKHPFNVEGMDIYPSSENLIIWIAGQLKGLDVYSMRRKNGEIEPLIDLYPGKIINCSEGDELQLQSFWSKLELDETCTSRCVLTRKEFNELSTIQT